MTEPLPPVVTCWNCMIGDHYTPPQDHAWFDEGDVKDARAAGEAAPTGICACPCADQAAAVAQR